MNRKNFLSKLAIGAAAVVVAPKVLIPKEEIKKHSFGGWYIKNGRIAPDNLYLSGKQMN